VGSAFCPRAADFVKFAVLALSWIPVASVATLLPPHALNDAAEKLPYSESRRRMRDVVGSTPARKGLGDSAVGHLPNRAMSYLHPAGG
jgi:hypothetical protein